jgi:hypothetical protein
MPQTEPTPRECRVPSCKVILEPDYALAACPACLQVASRSSCILWAASWVSGFGSGRGGGVLVFLAYMFEYVGIGVALYVVNGTRNHRIRFNSLVLCAFP